MYRSWVLLCCWLSMVLAEEPLRVAQVSLHYPPFHFEAGADRLGVYPEMLRAVLEEIGQPFDVVSLDYPELKPAYRSGRIHIICCTHPAWWQDDPDLDYRLFSMPLADNRDLWIFPRGEPFNPISELAGKRVALIRSFVYQGVADALIERDDHEGVESLLAAVADGRADAGIVNEWVLLWELRRTPMPFDLPQEQDRVTLHLLVHRDWQALLSRLNDAVDRLQANGTFERIIRSYLPGYRPVIFPADEDRP